ncbi:MAG: hypothetical protein ACSNEK_03545 [Parachlamydiaceae bacterium]
MLDRLFNSNEYITIKFPFDEEILLRRGLVSKIRKLENLLSLSHNNEVRIDTIAHETFDDVLRMMNGEDPLLTDSESINALKQAILYLEIRPSDKLQRRMTNVFKKYFPQDLV